MDRLLQACSQLGAGASESRALVDVLYSFGVLFALTNRDGSVRPENVVPAMLPDDPPLPLDEEDVFRTVEVAGATVPDRIVTRHTFTMNDGSAFMPLDFFAHLLARAHTLASVLHVAGRPWLWKHGCVYDAAPECVALLHQRGTTITVDARGSFPFYVWRCLCTCIEQLVQEYHPESMQVQWRLYCPRRRCEAFVVRLGAEAVTLPGRSTPCRECGAVVDLSNVKGAVGRRVTEDAECDEWLRKLGFGEAGGTVPNRVAAAGNRDATVAIDFHQLAMLRHMVLRAVAAAVARTHKHARLRRYPRTWFPVFNDTRCNDAGVSGVTLYPVCEGSHHVHVAVQAALHAAGVGVPKHKATALPTLCGAALERCAPYLRRVTCLIEAMVRQEIHAYPPGTVDRVAATRKRLEGLCVQHVAAGRVEPDWSWPGAEVDLSAFSHALRRVSCTGGEPGCVVWLCDLSPPSGKSGHVPLPLTPFARRLALVVGVSEYVHLGDLPRVCQDVQAVAAVLGDPESVGSFTNTPWPFGCLGFRPACDNAAVTDGDETPAAWRDKNVLVLREGEVTQRRVAAAMHRMLAAADVATHKAQQRADALEQQLRAAETATAEDNTGELQLQLLERQHAQARAVADAGCLLVFYWSGHGAVRGVDAKLVLRDYNPTVSDPGSSSSESLVSLDAQVIEPVRVYRACHKGLPLEFAVILDCCRERDGHTWDGSQAMLDATSFVVYACSPNSLARAAWPGSLSPLTAMLLAQLPLRSAVLPDLVRRAIKQVQAIPGLRQTPPQAVEGGAETRPGFVM